MAAEATGERSTHRLDEEHQTCDTANNERGLVLSDETQGAMVHRSSMLPIDVCSQPQQVQDVHISGSGNPYFGGTMQQPVFHFTRSVTIMAPGEMKTHQHEPIHGGEIDPERISPIASCSTQQVTAGKEDSLNLDMLEKCAEKLKARYKHTLKVTTHPGDMSMAMDIVEAYVKPHLLQEINSGPEINLKSRKEQVPKTVPLTSYKALLTMNDKNRILVTAETGYGKSTFVKGIAYDWADEQETPDTESNALSKYKLVLVLEVNMMGEDFDIINAVFEQLLTSCPTLTRESFEKYIEEHPDKVLILLDGADEVSFGKLEMAKGKNSINSVLSFKSLIQIRIIVTCRPFTAIKLLKLDPNYVKVIIAGFDEKQRELYINKYLKDCDEQSRRNLMEQINRSHSAKSIAEIPFLLMLECIACKSNNYTLPERRADLFNMAITLLQQHRSSTSHDKNPDTLSEDKLLILRIELGKVALEGLLNKGGLKLHFNEEEFCSEDLVTSGCNVGLLTRPKYIEGIRVIYQVRFFHKMFQEHCAATYLVKIYGTGYHVHLPFSKFKRYLAKILQCDIEVIKYLLIFCCGMNKDVATEIVTRIINDKLKKDPKDENFIRLTNLLLYESDLGSLVGNFSKVWKKDEWVGCGRFFFVEGEELLAMNYVMKHAPPNTRDMYPYPWRTILICHSLADLSLVKDIVRHTSCVERLEIKGVNITGNVVQHQDALRGVTRLSLCDCVMTADDVKQLFRVLATSHVRALYLSGVNLHGLLPEEIEAIPSLEWVLSLSGCGLTSSDVGAVFKLLSSLVNIEHLALSDNNLHGIQHTHTTPIKSLSVMFITNCGLTDDDLEALFSILSRRGEPYPPGGPEYRTIYFR